MARGEIVLLFGAIISQTVSRARRPSEAYARDRAKKPKKRKENERKREEICKATGITRERRDGREREVRSSEED